LLVQKHFPIERVFTSPVRSRSSRYQEAIHALRKTSNIQDCLTNGFVMSPWTVLHPTSLAIAKTARDAPVVALGIFDDVRLLVVPPLTRAAQNSIFMRHPELRADIIIAALSEDVEPASEWITSLRPQLLLLAESGASPGRQRRLLRRLNRVCPTMLVTSETGSASLKIQRNEWRVDRARKAFGPEREPETDFPDAQDE
jgi:hypothetical protein